jgi:CRISPR-associated protein Cas2
MVYSAHNEQHLNFRVHNTSWEPIDYDGLKLMMRPSPARAKALGKKRVGWSKASQYSKAHRMKGSYGLLEPECYVVFDIETTGLDVDKDQIIEIGAIRVNDGAEEDAFHALIAVEKTLSKKVVELTDITNDMLASSGIPLAEAIASFLEFVGESPVVAHNASFDCGFIQVACEECDLDDFDNQAIDTLDLAKKKLPNASNYRLQTLVSLLNLDNEHPHRAESDCEVTLQLFRKLIEM